MSETRMGYTPRTPLSTAQSGTAQWCFATGRGGEWFLKEFLSPVYPDDGLEMPADIRRLWRERFEAFHRDKVRLYSLLRQADDGNLVIAKDIFRHGNRLNIVTERVYSGDLSVEQVYRVPERQRYVLLRTLVNNVRRIHRVGVVHADLKPTNVILKATRNGYYTVKLIDFDNSFPEASPPDDPESFMMDLVYMAPEVFRFLAGDETARLSRKLDVFSLGILLHVMLSGEPPLFDAARYHYLYEAVLDGGAVRLSSRVDPRLAALLRRMLAAEPETRPELDEVFDALTGDAPPPPPRTSAPPPRDGGRNAWLKPAGNLL